MENQNPGRQVYVVSDRYKKLLGADVARKEAAIAMKIAKSKGLDFAAACAYIDTWLEDGVEIAEMREIESEMGGHYLGMGHYGPEYEEYDW